MWENSFVSETLEKMANGWQDKKGREFKMEVEAIFRAALRGALRGRFGPWTTSP